MNTPALHSALREWRTHMAVPARIAGLCGTAVILTLIQPFGTDGIEQVLPRFAYWLALVVATYSAGYFANQVTDGLTQPKTPLWARIALASLLTSLSVFGVIYLLNGLALDFWPRGAIFWEALFNVTVIATVITIVFNLVQTPDTTPAPPASGPPPLLDRVPFDTRAPLVSISVEDHYVRIRTTQGEAMVLLRLADALREVGDTPGLHVHRSHWAALDQITATARKGDGAILTMTHGPDIPVSRANLSKIKDAGLLPK